MNKIEIKYNQVIFLYAYLRALDLSIDRSRWTLWEDLQSYFKDFVLPSDVIQYIRNKLFLTELDFQKNVLVKPRGRIDRLNTIILGQVQLKKDEILYICKLLYDFDKILNSENKSYNLEIEKLRIDIAKFYTEVLETLITKKDLARVMKVEHFEQSDSIETVKLDKFIPNDFIE